MKVKYRDIVKTRKFRLGDIVTIKEWDFDKSTVIDYQETDDGYYYRIINEARDSKMWYFEHELELV